jgi:hypothetical protein
MDNELKQAVEVIKSRMASCATGDRHICVLDRGWIFVGNFTRGDDGVCTLADCSNVRKWTGGGGFGGLSRGAKSAKAQLDQCAAIRFREDALIFAVPISDGWENA